MQNCLCDVLHYCKNENGLCDLLHYGLGKNGSCNLFHYRLCKNGSCNLFHCRQTSKMVFASLLAKTVCVTGFIIGKNVLCDFFDYWHNWGEMVCMTCVIIRKNGRVVSVTCFIIGKNRE